jgi:hypothetical protein
MSAPSWIDFDLHGLVGIRLIDAGPREVAAVRRQLGPIECPFDRPPDIAIRFVDRLATRGRLRLVGLDAAWTDDAFLVLRGKHKSPARVQVPLADLGRPCEFVCERGLAAVPLLLAAVNLALLGQGVLPMHASAFEHQGLGVLVTGWAKGGKTETLLSFLARGAAHVADEWTYLADDGRMYGIPEPVRLWDWHLRQMPHFQSRVARHDRIRLQSIRASCAVLDRLASTGLGPLPRLRRLAELLKRQQNVQVPPHRLFGNERMRLAGSLDVVVLAASHDSAQIFVEPIDADEVARRMAPSLAQERHELAAYYRAFRFAFPNTVNELLETAQERERELLVRRLRGRPALALWHPYPVAISALYDALAPHLDRITRRPRATSPISVESTAHDLQPTEACR